MEGGYSIRAVISEVPLPRFSHLRARDRVIGHRIAHKLSETLRLHLPVCVNRQAVTVNFDDVTVNNDIALDQLQVNFECLWVAGKSGVQVFRCDPGQFFLSCNLYVDNDLAVITTLNKVGAITFFCAVAKHFATASRVDQRASEPQHSLVFRLPGS